MPDLSVFLPERQIASPEECLKMQIFITAIEGIHLIEKVPEEAGEDEIEPR